MAVRRLKLSFLNWFTTYHTRKLVRLDSKFTGLLNRVIQLAILITIIYWIFVHDKGYQYFDHSGIASSVSKLKGVAYSNSSDKRVGTKLWDPWEINLPSHGEGSFFITTNLIVTQGQEQGECPEHADVRPASCDSDKNCLPVGKPYHLGHGASTGRCDNSTKTCVIQAWCPVEDDRPVSNQPVFHHIADFTVYIKNFVFFPHFNETVTNLVEGIDRKYLRSCRYHPKDDPYCPIFRIGDIVRLTAQNDTIKSDITFDNISIKGGVISVGIKWDCNFDFPLEKCKPLYHFTRLDDMQEDKNHKKISSGFNFRAAHKYIQNSTWKRDITKRYGILFTIETEAVARAFDLTTCFMNIGSGVALLGISTIVMDIFIMYLHKKRVVYKECKIQNYKDVLREAMRRQAESILRHIESKPKPIDDQK